MPIEENDCPYTMSQFANSASLALAQIDWYRMKLADLQSELEMLRHFVGNNDVKSDYRTADDMRLHISKLINLPQPQEFKLMTDEPIIEQQKRQAEIYGWNSCLAEILKRRNSNES